MAVGTPDLTPAQRALLCIYQQWVDLARTREDQSEIRESFLWHDDDNPYHASLKSQTPASPPILASESLLCFLLPTFSWKPYSIFPIRSTDPVVLANGNEVRDTLQSLCEPVQKSHLASPLPNVSFDHLLGIIQEYYSQITDCNGEISFAGRSYFSQENVNDADLTDESLLSLDVTDAFTMGLSVSVRVLRLLWQQRIYDIDSESRERASTVCKSAATQFIESVHGLLQAFAVKSMEKETWTKVTDHVYGWDALDDEPEIREIRNQLINLGHPPNADGAFECGWSWGPNADSISTDGGIPVAEQAPYLYFTWTALEGIADLTDSYLDVDKLIVWLEDEEVIDSAHAILTEVTRLRTLAAITVRYWTILAEQQPDDYDRTLSPTIRITRIPWRTTDREESEYYTLYLLGIIRREAAGGIDPDAILALLEELSVRGRITTSPLRELKDGNIEKIVRDLHKPGKLLKLHVSQASENNDTGDRHRLRWRIYDYSPLLLKIAAHVRSVATDHYTRRRSIVLIEQLVLHLQDRQIAHLEDRRLPRPSTSHLDPSKRIPSAKYEQEGLLDRFSNYAGVDPIEFDRTSWYLTERTVEALLACVAVSPLRLVPTNLQSLVDEIAVELDHLGIAVSEALERTANAPLESLKRLLDQLSPEHPSQLS